MIGSSDNRVSYDGNGIATEFAYTFKILEKSDMNVLHVAADGTETLLTKDYYVDMEKSVVLYPGYAPGAEIPESERPPILPVGERLVLYREVPITQESALDKHWPFNVIEDGLDKLTIICQQIWDRLGRSFYVSESTSTNFNPKVPIEPGKTFRVNDDGTGFEVTEDPGKVIDGAKALLKQTTEQAEFAKEQADASSQSAVNAQNAANTAEKIATDLGLVDEAVQTAVASAEQASNSATTASNKADVATAKADVATTKASEASASASTATEKADAASTSATNAAQSYTNANAIAAQLTEYLATKETLTAPAVDKTLLIEGAAADSAVVGKLKKCLGSTDILPSCEILPRYYVNDLKEMAYSRSWIAYKVILSENLVEEIKVWSSSKAFYAIAFYNSTNVFDGTTFVGGINFSSDSGPTILDNIITPAGAICAIISNRTDTNTDIYIKGQQININNAIASINEALRGVGDLTENNITDDINGHGYILYEPVTGNIQYSVNWDYYKLDTNIAKIVFSGYTNNLAFPVIGFYSSLDVTNADTFISGIYFKIANQLETLTVKKEDIPLGTKCIILCSRVASGTDTSVIVYKGLNNTVDILKEDVEEIKSDIQDMKLGKGNVKSIFKNIPNTNDFTIIKNEIWFAENQYVDGVATDTTIVHRYKIENNSLVKIADITTDFGHWNCVDYCEENDCLIFGNGANSTSTEGNWFAVIPHPLNLVDTATVDGDGFRFYVDIGFKVQAVWGDNNFGKYNIVYLMSNNANTIAKVMLHKDSEGQFNGQYTMLEKTDDIGANIGIGGADFWGDTLYIGVGVRYRLAKMSTTDYSVRTIEKKCYYDDGTEYSGSTQGVHVDSKYIWVFSNVGGKAENYLTQYYR